MTKCISTITLLIIALTTSGQSITVSGFIEDAESAERLIGVNVFQVDGRRGTVTNNFGFFSLTIPQKEVQIRFSYIGYDPVDISVSADTFIAVLPLKLSDMELEKVTVKSSVSRAEQTQMSSVNIDIKQVKKIPALFGEIDILRTLQFLPGVQSGNEGNIGLYVRGGGPDQNLILIDGVPVYNVSHLFGFYSVFNADAIKSAELIKGGFPARFGGRLSSVLDITMKDGDMKRFRGEGSIGLISSKLTLEGPIIKDKTSFMISGRRTYIDALAQPFIAMTEPGARAGYYFGDFNIKVNHKFSDKDRLYASYFFNTDKFYFRFQDDFSNTRANLNWGNNVASIRWSHLFSSTLFMNVTATYTRYEWGSRVQDREADFDFALRLRSNIEDYGLKSDFEYHPNSQNHIRFGTNYIRHYFRPSIFQFTVQEFNQVEEDILNQAEQFMSDEAALYIENDQIINDRIKVNYGLHYNLYRIRDTYYQSLQPRVSGRYLLDSQSSLKLSFARMQQFLHLLSSNSGVGLPSDLWVPATEIIPPMMADQVALGWIRSFKENTYEVSVEGFYKHMTDLIEYRAGSTFINPNDWQSRVETGGTGWVYGGEVFLQKQIGDLTGWVGYTLSWNNRQFANLNNGNVFPYRFDRRHDVSVVMTYDISKKIDVSATWVYGTGIATNIPLYYVSTQNPQGGTAQNSIAQFGDLNSFRFPAYHRGDVSINFHKKKKKFERTWNISVYNVYNRLNTFFIFDEVQPNGDVRFRQVALFPILPSVSYRIAF